MIALAVGGAFLAVCLLFLAVHAVRAPLGYEDEHSFHEGERPSTRDLELDFDEVDWSWPERDAA